MKKNIHNFIHQRWIIRIALPLIILCSQYLHAQVIGVTQSGDGKSTIPLKGSAIGFDIGKTDFSFSFNNMNKVTANFRPAFHYGFNVNVKGEEGLGNLFSAGNITPSAEANFYAGWTFSNSLKLYNTPIKDEEEKIENKLKRFTKAERIDFVADLKVLVKSRKDGLNASQVDELNNLFKGVADSVNFVSVDVFGKTEKFSSNDAKLKEIIADLVKFAKERKKLFNEAKDVEEKRLKKLYDKYNEQTYSRWSILPFGGINAISFKRFVGTDSADLSNSFSAVEDRGGKLGLIINYQINRHWFGVSYAYSAGNNFSSLTKKEYTLKKTISLPPNELISQKTISAYPGKYGNVEWNELNFDYVTMISLDKEKEYTMLLNPYSRSKLYSRDTSLLNNKWDLGIGFYFMGKKQKFIGGFYIELPDVNNNAEKAKPADEQNLRSPFKRMSFGIVAKFSFSSLGLMQ